MQPRRGRGLKSVLDDFERDLTEHGYTCERVREDLLYFNVQHGGFEMGFEEEDDTFLRLEICFSVSDFWCSRTRIIECINEVHRLTHGVKMYLDEDGDVVFSVEMFLDEAIYFWDILFEQLNAIVECMALLHMQTLAYWSKHVK